MKNKIEILSKFFSKTRNENDNDLNYLLSLDDEWNTVYEKNKKQSFEEAKLIANQYIIEKVLNVDKDLVKEIRELSNLEYCQSADDMQNNLEDIHDLINDNFPLLCQTKYITEDEIMQEITSLMINFHELRNSEYIAKNIQHEENRKLLVNLYKTNEKNFADQLDKVQKIINELISPYK